MKERLRAMPPLRKQVVKFTLIGLLAVATDLLFYYLLLNNLPENLFGGISNEVLSKSVSFICGVFVTYNLNKYWTWRKKDRSNRRFVKFSMLYSGSLALNVFINSAALFILKEYLEVLPYKYFIAFVAATGASAMLNFIGQKAWVFKVRNTEVV